MNQSRTASPSFRTSPVSHPPTTHEHGSFAWFVRTSHSSCPNDAALPSHPIVILDPQYRLPGDPYQHCHPCLVITKKPLQRRASMPLAPWFPAQHAADRMLHQRTDGRYEIHPFAQNNHVSFELKMIRRTDLHPVRSRTGRRVVYAGLRANWLEVVERALAVRYSTPAKVGVGGRPDGVVATPPVLQASASGASVPVNTPHR